MKIETLDVVTKNTLAAQYRQNGMAVVPGVDLPDTFEPPFTDLVFLQVGDTCECYVSANLQYRGEAADWIQVSRRRPSTGQTRKVLETRGDLFTGVGKFTTLLAAAGGTYAAAATVVPPQPDPAQAPPAASEPAAPAPVPEPLPLPPRPVPRETACPDDADAPLPEARTPEGAPAPASPHRGGRSPGLRNLVEECRRSPRHYAGREEALLSLKTNLLRESKPGVVLIGKEGVGKSVLVEMLALDIAFNRNVPELLRNTPVFDLPLGALAENGRYVGDIERQARRYLDVPGRPVFFADEIHQLARPELRVLCDVLKPALAEGRIRFIGATTPVEWRKIEDSAFKRRFLEMTIDEPTPWETYVMLRERVRTLARHHGLEIEEAVIREAIMLGARFLPARQFPDKAIDVLDLAAALQATRATDENGKARTSETPPSVPVSENKE